MEQINSKWLSERLSLDETVLQVVAVEPVASGQGMIGAIYLIKTASNDLIIKCSPEEGSMWYAHLNKMQPFKREIETYRLISSRLKYVIPKCYYSEYSCDGRGIIILENLLVENAFMLRLADSVNLIHCKATLKAISKVHALHAVIAPDDSHDSVREWMFTGHSQELTDIFLEALTQTGIIFSEHLRPDAATQYLNQLDFDAVASILAKTHLQSKLFALCHGDLWLNNIVFRKEQQTIYATIIDWQFSTWGNPLVDVSFFIISALSIEKRGLLAQQLIKFYYTELTSLLPLSDYSIEDCFEDYNKANHYGLLMSLASLEAFIKADPENADIFIHTSHSFAKELMLLVKDIK